MTPNKTMRECDCGKPYDHMSRLQEITEKDPKSAMGTRDRYCCDICWQGYTQSQDDLEPVLSKDDLTALLV